MLKISRLQIAAYVSVQISGGGSVKNEIDFGVEIERASPYLPVPSCAKSPAGADRQHVPLA